MTTRVPKARTGKRYRTVIRYRGPVSRVRLRGLPEGLRWRARPGRIVVRGAVPRRGVQRFTVRLVGDGQQARHRFRLRVR